MKGPKVLCSFQIIEILALIAGKIWRGKHGCRFIKFALTPSSGKVTPPIISIKVNREFYSTLPSLDEGYISPVYVWRDGELIPLGNSVYGGGEICHGIFSLKFMYITSFLDFVLFLKSITKLAHFLYVGKSWCPVRSLKREHRRKG